jgi:hypothetical protein
MPSGIDEAEGLVVDETDKHRQSEWLRGLIKSVEKSCLAREFRLDATQTVITPVNPTSTLP